MRRYFCIWRSIYAKLSALVILLGVRTVQKKKRANETATSVRKDMRIDKELLAKIDNIRGDVPFAAWVKRAIIMRLDNLDPISQQRTTPISTSADTGQYKKTKSTLNVKHVRTSNEMRSKKTKQILFSTLQTLTSNQKVEILTARYPKSSCRKAIGEIVSKDTIAKYWEEIRQMLSI